MMIRTEEQRRWWFANHPEFSSKHRGGRSRRHGEAGSDDDKVNPKDVDAYVDEALKYETGPVAELLKSVKRNFGTEADLLEQWQDLLDEWSNDGEGVHLKFAQYLYDDRAFPRLPTMEELSRWPRDLARQFFRFLDAILRNNPLIINPDALEGHHGLPKDFIKYFLDCGVDIEEFIIIMRVADHRLKPGGVHTGKGRGGDWNREWEEFIEDHPYENSEERQRQISDKLKEMIEKYGIDKKAVLLPEKTKRW